MLETGQRIGRFKITSYKDTIVKTDISEVYIAEIEDEENNKQTAAIKVIKNCNQEFTRQAIKFWQALPEHPNILKLLENDCIDKKYFLVTQYIANGSLKKHIKEFQSPESISKLLIEILEGIIQIHSQEPFLIHRDIKPENILIKDDNTPVLTDFGSSIIYNPDAKAEITFNGTPIYSSPQALAGKVDKYNDLWGVGIIAYELIFGKHPYIDIIDQNVNFGLRNIINHINTTQILKPPYHYRKFESFIHKALNKNPLLRFSDAIGMRDALIKIMSNESNSFISINQTGNDIIDYTLNECIENIQLLLNRTEEPFRIEILKQVLNGLKSELYTLTLNQYEFDIGTEKNFLLRATPLFKNADKIYAISLDSISSFWTKKNTSYAQTYIENHPINTIRLFVFGNPKRAHKYSKILEANNRQYGSNSSNKGEGMVLLCSLESYKKFLSTYTGLDQDEYQKKDFGILDYGNYIIKATLDTSQLEFRKDHNASHTFKHMIDKFNKLLMLKDGDIDPDTKFLKWSSSFLEDKNLWAEKLKIIFEGKTGREYYHLVFFTPNVPQHVVVETKRQLILKKEELHLDDVWVGDRNDLNVLDRKYGGQIDTGTISEWNRILIMRFNSMDDLEYFYQHPLHSEIRKYAFSNFDSRLINLYEQIKSEKNKASQREIYQEIEKLAKQYMERRDYVDAENINAIVQHEPMYFPLIDK